MADNQKIERDSFWEELGIDPNEFAEEPAVQEEAAPAVEKPKKKRVSKKKKPEQKQKPSRPPTVVATVIFTALKTALAAVCTVAALALIANVALMSGTSSATAGGNVLGATIMDKFDMKMTNEISNALDGVLAIDKVYWLSDSDIVAPKPKASNYGTASTPAELNAVLEAAAELIGDQKMIFNESTPAWEGKPIEYYYDETILVITWKQVIDRVVYNMSEVKIAHSSQFRRFLADGEFGSDKLYITTDMAANVNAVVASSGDYYRFRRCGAVVYDGQLRRFESKTVDTCFINEDGDLLFAYRGDLKSEQEAAKFAEDNKVRFSLAFGPILVDNAKACPPESYALGEVNDQYARAAVCQVDKLHYLLVSACGEDGYQNRHTIADFAANLESFGVDKAYALDGGQTTVIAMDGKLYNDVEFGFQRQISDIIYFATAIPEGE